MRGQVYNPSAAKRLTAFVLFVIGVVLTICLFYIKTQSQTARNEVRDLEKVIAETEVSISVLEAELAYRQSPERLSKLAETHLGLAPMQVRNSTQLSEIDKEFPLRELDLEGVDD